MIRRAVLLLLAALTAVLAVPAAVSAAPDEVVKVAVVRSPGQNGGRADSLAQIAERTLGDPARAAEILDLNRSRPQSDGGTLTDSGEVRPGWVLLLPADATGPDVRLGRIGSTPAADSTPLLTWKVAAALLGAVILALLSLLVIFRRRIVARLRERRRAYADNARWHRQIQERMRTRAQLSAEFAADQKRPALAWQASAELTADQVEAYALRVDTRAVTAWVTADHTPRPPWLAEADGVWTRPADAVAGRPARGDAVTPCLVRVGGDDNGTLFVDLTWLDGVLAIGGSAGVAIDVLANLMADLSRFRPDLPVLSVPGLGGQPPGLPQSALRLGSVTELRINDSGPETDDGMVRLAARRRSLTALAVIAETPSADEAAHLLAACGPGTGQVAIVLGDLPGARWRWHAEADGKVRLPEIGVTATAPSR
ncbi:hypothetical protein [Micromonospora sediminimaris]|uniref:Uncharacterized protein n=1 Tax=Micromonospora sediminimaris TaxID=547162 RepID=A0A9W5UML0_9ACTN|nr:hypothetical protein [Micromonospora sediminimaris]GIJ31606.1 hypothetical protein Vse01_07540 [Micromonospora sediminimaris]SFC35012.1 hypothetical protein SAMN05216284_10440 [Micromonospora sediminimaris]